MAASDPPVGRIKCVVWDLDNTMWDGVLLEPGPVRLRQHVVEHIRRLDQMGILHSVASKNDWETAQRQLEEFGLAGYFLHPQITWSPKSDSVSRIAKALNIGIDAIAFVDDQPFELAEVAHAHPGVLCVDTADVDTALRGPAFQPRFVTAESQVRRDMYQAATRRDDAERDFDGTSEDFLATLDMEFTVRAACRDDLRRAEELTVRTNQLNSTGRTYSYEELEALLDSDDHLLLVASLTDRFGGYGTVGLCLVRTGPMRTDPVRTGPVRTDGEPWQLLLLLMSCRVMSRGVGTILLNYVMATARSRGARLRAEFIETGRNRIMYVTYMFAGFQEISRDGEHLMLESGLADIQPPPGYVRLRLPDEAESRIRPAW